MKLAASPQTLAAFRIAVGFSLLLSSEIHSAPRFAALAPALRIAPEGLGWFFAIVPVSETLARAAVAVAMFGAVATMVGIYTQVAAPLLAASAFYLLGLGQLSGTVVHDMHLVWFAAILAVSPCADVWSFDAWWSARESNEPRGVVVDPATRASAVAVAVWTARALFACIYFFPGFWKVATQGLDWALSDNLSYQLYWKWFEWGEVPAFRLDQHPGLLKAGGSSVLAFELGFPLLLLTWRTRLLAAAFGLAFHLASERFFRIPFSSLWLCYPVLLDFPLSRGAPGPSPSPARWMRTLSLEVIVCAALVVGAVVQGARAKTDAFPFACYPTFQYHPPRDVPDLRIVAVTPDGTSVEVAHARNGAGVRAQARWGQIWALVGATEPVVESRLFEYAVSEVAANPSAFATADRVEMFRTHYSVVPEARGRGPTATTQLASFPIAKIRERLLQPRSTP